MMVDQIDLAKNKKVVISISRILLQVIHSTQNFNFRWFLEKEKILWGMLSNLNDAVCMDVSNVFFLPFQ